MLKSLGKTKCVVTTHYFLIVSPQVDEIIDDIDMGVVHPNVKTNELVFTYLIPVEKFNKEKNYPFFTNVLNKDIIL